MRFSNQSLAIELPTFLPTGSQTWKKEKEEEKLKDWNRRREAELPFLKTQASPRSYRDKGTLTLRKVAGLAQVGQQLGRNFSVPEGPHTNLEDSYH